MRPLPNVCVTDIEGDVCTRQKKRTFYETPIAQDRFVVSAALLAGATVT